MANIGALNGYTAEQLAGALRNNGISAELKAACEEALKSRGIDTNGDGSVDVNDYGNITMSSNDLRKLEADFNPAKRDISVGNGKDAANQTMVNTNGQVDDKDYNSGADFHKTGNMISSGMSTIATGVTQFASKEVTLEAGTVLKDGTKAKGGEKVSQTSGWGIAAAAMAVAAATMDITLGAKAVSDANAMNGKNSGQEADAKNNISAAEYLNNLLAEGSDERQALEEMIAQMEEEALAAGEEYNQEALDLQAQDMVALVGIAAIQERIKAGEATETDIEVLNAFVDMHNQYVTETTGISNENLEQATETSGEMQELSTELDTIQATNDETRGAAEQQADFAAKNIKIAQQDQQAAQKMQQNGQQSMMTDAASGAMDTVSSIQNFASAYKGLFIDINALVAGGMYAGAAVTEGVASGMEAVGAHKSEQNVTQFNNQLNTFGSALDAANGVTANVDVADADLATSGENIFTSVDNTENFGVVFPDMSDNGTGVTDVNGKPNTRGSEGKDGADNKDDSDKDPNEDKKA